MKNIYTTTGVLGVFAVFALALGLLFGWKFSLIPLGFGVAIGAKKESTLTGAVLLWAASMMTMVVIHVLNKEGVSMHLSDRTAEILKETYFGNLAFGCGIFTGLCKNSYARNVARAALK